MKNNKIVHRIKLKDYDLRVLVNILNEARLRQRAKGENNSATKSTTYNLTYDVFGNSDSISVGSRELASYEYNEKNGELNTINYGNGFSVRYVYDNLENIAEVWYSNGCTESQAYQYTYTAYFQ